MNLGLGYPIGIFTPAGESDAVISAAVGDIEALPANLHSALRGLDDRQLDPPYRPGGWTVRQVVHHIADSHMNGFVRTRLALTEANPVIKPYDEHAWSQLAD